MASDPEVLIEVEFDSFSDCSAEDTIWPRKNDSKDSDREF